MQPGQDASLSWRRTSTSDLKVAAGEAQGTTGVGVGVGTSHGHSHSHSHSHGPSLTSSSGAQRRRIHRGSGKGKKFYGSHSSSTSSTYGSSSSSSCVIPFRSDISADEVRSEATLKTIESEFVCKYLEKIGVTPTKATADLMRKLTPISLSTLETQLKPGKSSETDVCISLKMKTATDSKTQNASMTLDHNVPTSSDVISLGILAQLPEQFSRELEQELLAKEKSFSSFDGRQGGDNGGIEGAGGRSNIFEHASTHHLFPYNLKKKNASKSSSSLSRNVLQDTVFSSGTAKLKAATSAINAAAAASKRLGISMSGGGSSSHSQLVKEQSEEVTEHHVEIFQKDFIAGLEEWRSQNSVSLKGSFYLNEKTFSNVRNTLMSRPVLKLFKVTATYLKEKFINKQRGPNNKQSSVSEARKETEQAERLFFILHEFSRLNKANRKEKIGLCFVLPVLLLSLRSFVEHVVNLLFPTLMATPEGKGTLQKMDGTITTLLDSHGWFSRVSCFQSTRTAMQIMNSYRQSAHQPIRTYFHHTSPLVRAALGNPLSSQYRTFLQNSQTHDETHGNKLQESTDHLGIGHRERLLGASHN